MKNIKLFKFKDTLEFQGFISSYNYKLEDVKGFSLAEKRQYHGNILKIYSIRFNDGEYEYFKVVFFESFNEYRQSGLGFNGDKLWSWFQDANIRKYNKNSY